MKTRLTAVVISGFFLSASLLIVLSTALAAEMPQPQDSIATQHATDTTLAGPEDKLNQARSNAKALGGALKSRLQQAISKGGLEAGVEECYVAAGPIAEALKKDGWTVGRTALQVRNQDNQPDAWEETQLHEFADALSKQLPMPLEASQWNEETGELRYMSAIVTGQVCTACHGNNVAPAVLDIIKEKYPEDTATGLAPGSLRGAFTLTYSPE